MRSWTDKRDGPEVAATGRSEREQQGKGRIRGQDKRGSIATSIGGMAGAGRWGVGSGSLARDVSRPQDP